MLLLYLNIFGIFIERKNKMFYRAFTPGSRFVAPSLVALGYYSHGKETAQAQQAPTAGPFETLQYPANAPIEDRVVALKNTFGWFFAVYDGHGGWQCAEYAHERLHENLKVEVENRSSPTTVNQQIDPHVMMASIRASFERTDREYMALVKDAFTAGFGRDTRAGSCALAAIVHGGVLYVANAGDSRAVMGINRRERDAETRRQENLRKAPGDTTPDIVDPDDLDVPSHSKRMAMDALGKMDASLREAAIAIATNKDVVDKVTQSALRNSMLESMHSTRARSHAELQISGKEETDCSTDPGRDAASAYIAQSVSHDHNCRESVERMRLEHEHPGENDVVVCRSNGHACYIKGKLQPSRALGDFYLKYSEFVPPPGSHSSRGRRPKRPFSPPYIRATPEIEVRPLTEGLHEFLILGTDGLWDYVSNQEAVDVVGECFDDGEPFPVKRAVDRLKTLALTKAGEKKGLTIEQMMRLPQGRSRRSKHDDISIVVINFRELK